MSAPILAIIGQLLKFGVSWFTAKNSKEMVQRAEAQGQAVNTDEIRQLIHDAHFAPDPKRKAAALEELRRRGSMT